MKVYVIVVTYNGKKWIQKCLDSLYTSEIQPEIIVVDNASDDGTETLIKEDFPKVILIELKENIGFGRANNVGLSQALKNQCDYVFLMNQDVQVFPQTIGRLLEVSRNNENYGIISPVHLDGLGRKLDQSFIYYLKKSNKNKLLSDLLIRNDLEELYDFEMINAAAWLLPVKTLKVVGGFNPMFFLYGEDDNYCQRVLYHGLKIGVVPNSFILHDSENNNLIQPAKGSSKYYQKFLTNIKVQYGNINKEVFYNLSGLKNYYYIKAFKSLIKLQLKDFQINRTKGKLVGELDFKKDIAEGRKKKSCFLNSE